MIDGVWFREADDEYLIGPTHSIRRLLATSQRSALPYEVLGPRDAVRVLRWRVDRDWTRFRSLLPSHHHGRAGGSPDDQLATWIERGLTSFPPTLSLVRRRVRPFLPRLVAPPTVDPVPAPELTWYELALVDEGGSPIPRAEYVLTLPSGRVRSGTLDDRGHARVYVESEHGAATVAFPELTDSYEIAPR